MKWRKITLLAEAISGSEQVEHHEAAILFSPVRGVLVNEKPVPHHGFTLGAESEDGFLTLTLLNVTEEVFNEFMDDETPDDVLEGTGIPTFTSERSSDDDPGGPDSLTWYYGANIVLPVHDLELRVVAPVEA